MTQPSGDGRPLGAGGLAAWVARGMRALVAVYNDRRLLILLFLGFSSGLPLKLVYATLALWLADAGIDRTTVGLLGLASLPYSLKFLWAPLLDRVAVPVLSARFGRRRAWMLVAQVGVMGGLAAMATTDPAVNITATAIATLTVAFFSATQDVAIDGYRVELLSPEEQGAGAAASVIGYRLGMLAASAGALHLVAALDGWSGLGAWWHGHHGDTAAYTNALSIDAWSLAYAAMAALVGVGMAATLLAPQEPVLPEELEPGDGQSVNAPGTHQPSQMRWLWSLVVAPFLAFAKGPGWRAALGVLLTFKLGDALAAAMTNTFLREVGFSLSQIANLRETWGLVASLFGVAVGGQVVRLMGVFRAMWLALGIMMASNLLFSVQALVGADPRLLTLTIGVENLTGGVATAAFVAWLSGLCDRRHAATQYALLTSLAAFAHITLGANSGWLAGVLGWPGYFAATTVATAPAFWLLARFQRSQAAVVPP